MSARAARLWLLVAAMTSAGATGVNARIVCATCLIGSELGRCRVVAGYGVNCVYLPVTELDGSCAVSAEDVFGADFNVRDFVESRGLVAAAMLSTNTSSVATAGALLRRLSECRAAISEAQPLTSWPVMTSSVL
jgi:hypothetical protein